MLSNRLHVSQKRGFLHTQVPSVINVTNRTYHQVQFAVFAKRGDDSDNAVFVNNAAFLLSSAQTTEEAVGHVAAGIIPNTLPFLGRFSPFLDGCHSFLLWHGNTLQERTASDAVGTTTVTSQCANKYEQQS